MYSQDAPLAFCPAEVTKVVLLSSFLAFTLALQNARSIRNKTSLTWDLISNEEVDLSCITETWLRGNTDVSLQEFCPRFQCTAPG